MSSLYVHITLEAQLATRKHPMPFHSAETKGSVGSHKYANIPVYTDPPLQVGCDLTMPESPKSYLFTSSPPSEGRLVKLVLRLHRHFCVCHALAGRHQHSHFLPGLIVMFCDVGSATDGVSSTPIACIYCILKCWHLH